MKTNTPLIMLECGEDYTILYLTVEHSNNETTVRAFSRSVPKEAVKEYYLKNNVTPSEILYYFRHTAGEDTEHDLLYMTELFKGCKILAVIP